MPFKYTTITQPVPLGGLNTRDEPTLMSRLQSPDLHNIEINRSFIKKRLGYIKLGTNLPLANTLVGHWKMNDNADTKVVLDASATDNDGVSVNNTSGLSTTGAGSGTNESLDLDGSTDQITISDHTAYDFTKEFSVFCWVNPDTFANNECFISKYLTSGDLREWAFVYSSVAGSDAKLTVSLGKPTLTTTSVEETDAIAVTTGGGWYHVGFTYSAGVIVIYVDGAVVASSTTGSHVTTVPNKDIDITIGTFNGGDFHDGPIDDVRIYSRCLSLGDVVTLYASGNGTEASSDEKGMELIQYTDGQGVQHNILLTTSNAYLYNSSTDTWDNITPVAGQFTGTDINRWSHTTATNTSLFTNNGGTALIIENGVDGPFYYEGDSGDVFTALTVSTDLTSFNFTKEVADFWNHLFLLNYNAAAGGVTFSRNTAFHDVSSDGAYSGLGITEVILTDSIGKLKRAKKLGYDMILYSDNSITICRRVGGTSLFIFPTVVYETGLFADKGVWDFVNQHFFLGTDQKIYTYQGGTQLVPIGLLVEEAFFQNLDPSKPEYIVTGHDQVKKKIYWFAPKVSDTYAKSYHAYNYDKTPKTWEKGRFADTVADMSIFNNQSTWAFNGPQVAGKAFNDAEFAATSFTDGVTVSGFPQTIFLSREGEVFRFTTGAASDNGTDIEAWFTTPDLVPIEGRTDEYARFSGFGFSGKADIASSTVLISFSTDEGLNWTDLETVTLTSEWAQYRVPCDVKTQKLRFRIYQNSAKDFQIRSLSYKVQLGTDK